MRSRLPSLGHNIGQLTEQHPVKTKAPPVALITGGAHGLGAATCVAMAKRGVHLIIADIDQPAAETTVATCREIGVKAHFIHTDLAQTDGPARLVSAAHSQWQRLDILVNNAAYAIAEPFIDMSADEWDRVYALNIRAVALTTASAGRVMRQQGSGRIVNITSPASRMALPNYTAYAASKAAVDAITRAAAVALATDGVRVNSVAPGMMDTALQEKSERELLAIEGRTDLASYLEERTARIPLAQRVTTSDVAAAIIYLALDAPDYVTAERLNISGGLDRD